MTDSSNNPNATLPYVTQLSQQDPDDEDEAEEPNNINDIITEDTVSPNTNTNTSNLPNVADIAFHFIVKKNPHIHPVQHSQMMSTVLILLQSTSECCEKIGKLSAKCKRAKAKSIELTNIVNSVTQQIRPLLLTNKANPAPHLNPDLVIPIIMPHSSPDRKITKVIYDRIQCYLTIVRVLAHDYDTSTDVNVTVLNPNNYLVASNVPSLPASSRKAPSHSGSAGDPDGDGNGGDDDDDDDDDDDEEDEADAALFAPHRKDIDAMKSSIDIIDFIFHHLSVMRDNKSNERYLLSQTIRSYANELYAYQQKKKVRFFVC